MSNGLVNGCQESQKDDEKSDKGDFKGIVRAVYSYGYITAENFYDKNYVRNMPFEEEDFDKTYYRTLKEGLTNSSI